MKIVLRSILVGTTVLISYSIINGQEAKTATPTPPATPNPEVRLKQPRITGYTVRLIDNLPIRRPEDGRWLTVQRFRNGRWAYSREWFPNRRPASADDPTRPQAREIN